MSAPHVAGVVALLAEYYRTESMVDWEKRIMQTAMNHQDTTLDGFCITGGRLDLYDSLIIDISNKYAVSFSANLKWIHIW